MKLVSINVGLPRLLAWGGATFKTGIFKQPVQGRIMLRTTNLDGDRQADLSVHGGPNKAVYCYPCEHYAAWNAELPDAARTWGAFGENFTTEGLLETTVSIGDRYRVGNFTPQNYPIVRRCDDRCTSSFCPKAGACGFEHVSPTWTAENMTAMQVRF